MASDGLTLSEALVMQVLFVVGVVVGVEVVSPVVLLPVRWLWMKLVSLHGLICSLFCHDPGSGVDGICWLKRDLYSPPVSNVKLLVVGL